MRGEPNFMEILKDIWISMKLVYNINKRNLSLAICINIRVFWFCICVVGIMLSSYSNNINLFFDMKIHKTSSYKTG